MADLSKYSDEELQAMLAQVRAQPKAKPKLDAIDQARMDPTADMPWYEKAAAGAGKAVVDMGRGIGQWLPGDLVSREEIDESKKRDAALMNTGWGLGGNVAVNLIPALALPATNIPKALAYGAGLGAAQPVGTQDSRTENMLVGAGMNALVPAAVGAYRTGRAIAEPVIAPGRTAARVVEQFADDPQALRLAAQGATELVPGAKPTLAQVAQQPGISSLERGAANQPGPLQSGLTQRALEQNAARQAALGQVAGSADDVAAMAAARDRAAAASVAGLKRNSLTKPIDVRRTGDLIDRMLEGEAGQRPKIAAKLEEARAMLTDAEGRFKTDFTRLYGVRKGIGDMMDELKLGGVGDSAMRELVTVKKSLDAQISKSMPEFGDYLKSYREASKGIDQRKVLQAVRDKAESTLPDAMGNRTLRAGPLAAAIDSPSTIRGATGFKRAASLDDFLEPAQASTLKAVRSDLERAHVAENLGKARGSPTAQYLTTQNLMRQIMGPLGLPAGAADKVAGMVMGTPVLGNVTGALMKGPEGRVQRELAELLLDPSRYASAYDRIHRMPGPIRAQINQAAPYAPALLTQGLFAYGGQ